MSQRDRDGSRNRGRQEPPGRYPEPLDDFYTEDDDLPSWGGSPSSARSRRPSDTSYGRSPERPPSRATRPEPTERPTSSRSGQTRPTTEFPTLGDAFRSSPGRSSERGTSRGRPQPEPEESEPLYPDQRPARRPAERPPSSRSRREPVYRTEPYDEYLEEEDEAYSDYPPTRGRRAATPPPSRRGARVGARGRAGAAQAGAFAAQFDRLLLAGVLLGVLSTILMTATLATRISGLPDWLPIHQNAAGVSDRWGTPATLWRIPLLSIMSTIVIAVVGWFAARREPPAMLVAMMALVLMQLLVWVALVSLAF